MLLNSRRLIDAKESAKRYNSILSFALNMVLLILKIFVNSVNNNRNLKRTLLKIGLENVSVFTGGTIFRTVPSNVDDPQCCLKTVNTMDIKYIILEVSDAYFFL